MNIVVAGTRTYENYEECKAFIDDCLKYLSGDITFLSGGCKGADMLGERYAREHGYNLQRYLPDWEKFGRRAGPERNKRMIDDAHIAIVFWDGVSKGTKNLVKYAESKQIPLFMKEI